MSKSNADGRAARLAWNNGKVGASKPSEDLPLVEPCTVTGCGTPATDDRPPVAGMLRIVGAADGADARWYCPGRCAVLARTRAELRAVPMRRDGEP